MQPGTHSAFMSDMSRVLLTFVNATLYGWHQTGKEGDWCISTATCCRLMSRIFFMLSEVVYPGYIPSMGLAPRPKSLKKGVHGVQLPPKGKKGKSPRDESKKIV